MAAQIFGVVNGVLQEPLLPSSAFAVSPVGAGSDARGSDFEKHKFIAPPTLRKVMIAWRQTPVAIQIFRQDADCHSFEGMAARKNAPYLLSRLPLSKVP